MIKKFVKHYARSNAVFRQLLNNLQRTESYSKDEIILYQQENLYNIIKFSYDHVPFYKELLDSLGMIPQDFHTIESLQELPIINKQIVQNSIDLFRNKSKRRFNFKTQTGGTTGTPATFYRDLFSINFENAALWRQWKWAGKPLGSKRVTLRGDIIIPTKIKEPPFWKYNSFSRELLMSSYHLSENSMELFIGQIKNNTYFDLYAYPSTAYLLASYCIRNKISLSFKAVFTSSEVLQPYQRETIEKAFQCQVWDWYGQVERVSAIGQCQYGSYHIMEDYSFTELVPIGDNMFEVVGTSFFNKVMPLIRYRTGDVVEFDNNDALCRCGRNFRKVKITVGRETDYIKTPEGRQVSIVNHIPRGINNLIEMQFVQKELHKLILRIVCAESFSHDDALKLIKNAQEHISHEMKYEIEKVKKIERGPRGKFIPVVSEI